MTIKQQPVKILSAFLLLIIFAVGQLIIIAHTHKQNYSSHQNQSKKDSSDDKCKICAQNHHTQLFYQQQQDLFSLALTRVNNYLYHQDSYPNVMLCQASNRGPPVS